MLSEIFNIGVDENLTESVAKKVRITNRIAILFVSLCIIYVFISIFLNDFLLAKYILVIAFTQLTIIYFNYLSLVNLSRISFSCINAIIVYALNNTLGEESGVRMFYCAVFFAPLVRFNLDETWQLFVCYLFITLIIVLNLYIKVPISETTYSIEEQKRFLPYIFPLTIATILINGISIIRELKTIESKAVVLEKRVLAQNSVLIKSNNRLKENENDLKLIVSSLNDSVLLFDKNQKLIKQWGLNINSENQYLKDYFSSANLAIIKSKIETTSLTNSTENFELSEKNKSQYFKCVLYKTLKNRYVLSTSDVTERRQMKLEAEKRKNLLENVVSHIPIDIVLFDQEHKYQLVNKVAIRNTETRNWIIGKDDFDYCKKFNKPIELAEKRREEFNKVINGQDPLEWEEELKGEKESRYILRKMSPIIQKGVVEYIIGFAIDISKIKIAEKKLLHVKNIAVENAKEKSQFLSTMSHEIRTPLNAIIGLSHLLLDHSLKDESKDYVNSLHFSAKNLLNLINDILDYNKIESGNLTLEKRSFNLLYLLEQLVNQHKHSADERGNNINLITPKNLPLLIIGDEARLSQIINNLLGNANKFTENGAITLKTSCSTKDNLHYTFNFEVIDTGIGIKEENQEKIFKSFIQENASTTRKYGGTGLGLAICKNLVEIMGGTLQLKSKFNKGTNFYFSLNFESRAAETTQKKPKNNKLPSTKKVLLVEDNQMNALIVENFLNQWKIRDIDFAENGVIALEKASNRDYDLILMDLQMPKMDGYTTSQNLRKRNIQTPIIALTAEALSDVRDKIYESGMNSYISKPFDPKNLFNTLSEYLLLSDKSS